MTRRWFPPLTTFLVAGLLPAVVAAQEDTPAPERAPFERRYIDASERRSNPVLLRDWPELERLVRWSHALQTAVAADDDSVPGRQIEDFRARLDSLEAAPRPAFLAGAEDSLRATLASIRADLDGAEAVLARPTLTVSPAFGAGANAPERQRTLVTGGTAVTVPAGVAVGQRDSLPAADLTAAADGSYLDRMADALSGLDRLVHHVRGARREPASGPPEPPAPAPSGRTEPRPPAP